MGYELEQASPQFVPVPNQEVVNQFGTIFVDVTRPAMLLVPSAKSLTDPPQPLVNPAVDHFKCYKVKGARQQVSGLEIEDQFGTLRVNVKKPISLCVPADKNGEGILDSTTQLMCYKIRLAAGAPLFRGLPGPIFVDNQFGPDSLRVARPAEFCEPSQAH